MSLEQASWDAGIALGAPGTGVAYALRGRKAEGIRVTFPGIGTIEQIAARQSAVWR